MKRFFSENYHSRIRTIASVGIFLLVISSFGVGIGQIERQTHKMEREHLEKAIYSGITRCYAIEGHYPESLEYLEEEYGILYNDEDYFIDYHVLGQNIYPEVTIVEK